MLSQLLSETPIIKNNEILIECAECGCISSSDAAKICPTCLSVVYCCQDCMDAAREAHQMVCKRDDEASKMAIRLIHGLNMFPFTRLLTLAKTGDLVEVPVPIAFALANLCRPATWIAALSDHALKTILICPQLMLRTAFEAETSYRKGQRLQIHKQNHSVQCRRRRLVVLA